MLIGIFSDCHCGYKYGEERWKDSFIALNESIDKTLDCDMIIIAGDIFDTKVPKPEVFAKVARILSKAQSVPSKTKFVKVENKEEHEVSPLALRGVPIVAIHGTHERRSKHFVNPVQALEHAGLLLHLNCATAIFEVNGKKIAIHGMSGVPERYAKDKLLEWDPKPVPNALNILMIHQSISPYIYSPLEPPSLDIEDLPEGFDLHVLGHMHWHSIKPLKNKGQVLVCGSTIPTSIHKIETNQSKSIFKYDGTIRKIDLENQRKIFWKEFEVSPSLKDNIKNFISTISASKPKPIINIKIKGLVKKDYPLPSFSQIEEKFKRKGIININRSLEVEGFKRQIETLRKLRNKRLSPEEYGLKILRENLDQVNCGIKAEEIFEYLVEGKTDLVFDILTGKQKTLRSEVDDNKS